MNRFGVWTPVMVKNEEHERAGQAGVVYEVNPGIPDEVVVKFDLDGHYVAVAVDDLRGL